MRSSPGRTSAARSGVPWGQDREAGSTGRREETSWLTHAGPSGVHDSAPPASTPPSGTPIQLAASPKLLRVCRRLGVFEPCTLSTLSSQPGSPHSSAAQPPDFVLLWRRFWRRLTTLNAHRCGVSVGDAWERVTKLYKRPAQSDVPARRAPLYQELASHVKKNLQLRLQVRKVNATAAC